MITRLPLELVTEIFLLCLPYDLCDPLPSLAPLLLAHVCSDWRRIAFGTPKLWNTLALSDQNARYPKTELIEEWVSRTDLVALSLWFGSWEVPAAVLHLVSRHSAKWTTLEFHYPFHWGMPGRATSVPTLPHHFPSLKKLVVAPHPRTDEYLRQSNALGSAPQLCEVRFEGAPQILNLPWAQLTKLTCAHPIGVTDMLRVLSLTPNLVHFGVASIPVGMERTTAQPLLRLIHLETLIFHHGGHDRTQSVALLGKIALPALLKLDVATLNPFEVPLLNSFLSRASCKLVAFAVNTQATPMASLIPCLQIILNLTSLHLTVFPSDGAVAFFERLGTDTTYLPKLQHLTVVSDGRFELPYSTLSEMLLSRAESEAAPLRRFALHWTSQPCGFFPDHIAIHKLAASTGVELQFEAIPARDY